ncbi:transglutaminase family protein [Sphingomonas hylomeconis]|uniref:Transglutaminase N-terminal domain-containing protein n=1 Tax=Sphingomonas hylomeconis TaxID=1395958 RepID=A0ABV7SUU4_9SPHN|nr:transglutaminase family protein [Sphingomonas hylomeconis]
MRLSIDHHTIYRFSVPQGRLTQMLRLTPEDTHDQTVASWHLHVDCDARLRPGRDGFGNKVTMLYVAGPIDSIEIAVSGEVLTNSADGVVHGAHEVLPPALFLRATPLTLATAAIADFTASAVSAGTDLVGRLHRLNLALNARFVADRDRPVTGRTAAQAFALDRATPRDMAHVFIAAARTLGVPARYVSGYSRFAFGGEHRPAPHGWAEAYVAGLGWVAFDPSAGRSADEAYVRVAVALDAAGAAAVAGSRLGEGDEEMDVDVTVAPASD